MDYVLYHGDCPDGFGSALAAWKRLGDDARYIPAHYGHQAPAMEPGSRVFILDFSFGRATLEKMAEDAKQVVVVDHHKTAEVDLHGLPPVPAFGKSGPKLSARFDMGKSGAVLSWDYFNSEPAPELLLYVQDRDLWHWRLPKSREVSAGLGIVPLVFAEWNVYLSDVAELSRAGTPILAYQHELIKALVARMRRVSIAGRMVPAVNTGLLASEICDQLLSNHPEDTIAACYFDSPNGRVFSLRSRPGSDVDVSEIARLYGGGGHMHAAGFTIPV